MTRTHLDDAKFGPHMPAIRGSATSAAPIATGMLNTRASSNAGLAVFRNESMPSWKAEDSRGSMAVPRITGTKRRVVKTLVGTEYHPTTTSELITESITESIHI